MRLLNYSIILLIYISFITGCGGSHKPELDSETATKKTSESSDPAHDHELEAESAEAKVEDEHNHETEEVKILITSYSNDLEVFAEADPFISGEESRVLAHFTYLKDFKPIESGSITLTLIVGEKRNIQKLEQPTRKGIYDFKVKPDFAGKGKIVFDVSNEKGSFQVIAEDITVYNDDHEAIHEAEEKVISSPNAISFTKEQSWKIDFATEKITAKPFGQIIKTSAKILSAPSDEITISAKSNGIISVLDNILTEGIKVNGGQNLLLISGSDLAENNSKVRFTEAKNDYENKKSIYERNNVLIKDKIISEKEFQQSTYDFVNARTLYENLKQNFSANGQIISSPVTGTLQKVFIKNGQYVEAGEPLVSISKNNILSIQAGVQQTYASQLNSIESVNFRLVEQNIIYSLKQLNGKIASVGNSTLSNSNLLPVVFQIDFTDGFVPGGFVEVFINTKTNNNSISVPNSALIEEQGYFAVFVQLTPELFEKREVEIGTTDGLNTKILKGLSENDRIVTQGAILVKLAAVSNSLDPHAGHVH